MSTSSAQQVATSKRVDPTRTASLRGRLASRLAGGYGTINAQIRRDVVERDVFGLRDDTIEQLAEYPTDDSAGGNYDAEAIAAIAALPISEQVRRFREWLDRQQEGAVRGRLSRERNAWLLRAYNQSIPRAETALRDADYTIDSVDPTDVPRRETTLDEARSRFHDRLTAAINDTTAEAGQVLQEGLSQEIAASVLAKGLIDRINHSRAGKTRVREIGNSSVVRLANEAALDRYTQTGVSEVGAQVEVTVEGPLEGTPPGVEPESVEPEDEPRGTWSAVMDAATCPQCATLNGQTFRISDIRSGVAPLPIRDTHGNCRCFYNKPLPKT